MARGVRVRVRIRVRVGQYLALTLTQLEQYVARGVRAGGGPPGAPPERLVVVGIRHPNQPYTVTLANKLKFSLNPS